MRLIDADKLNFEEQIYSKSQFNAILDFIDKQPTAYDVEKVTKELNDFALNTEQYCVEHIANGICEDCETCNECVLRKAIEIVRNGGKE